MRMPVRAHLFAFACARICLRADARTDPHLRQRTRKGHPKGYSALSKMVHFFSEVGRVQGMREDKDSQGPT